VEDIRRRDFVLRGGGGLAGMLAVALLGPAGLLDQAMGATASALTPERERTYRALVTALAADGVSLIDRSRIDDAVAAFSDAYGGAVPERRQYADAVLDALASGVNGSFADADQSRQIQLVRDWFYDGDGRPGDADARSRASAHSGSPDQAAVVRQNANAQAGAIDPVYQIRVVPLDHEKPAADNSRSPERRRRCALMGIALTWAVQPFVPRSANPEDSTPAPLVAV
jgi:hypothetical protein